MMSEAKIGEAITELIENDDSTPPEIRPEKDTDIRYTYLVYQMLVAVALIILIILFKIFGGRFYGYTREKYITTFDQNLSVTQIKQTVKDVFSDLGDGNAQNVKVSLNDTPELLDTYISKVTLAESADDAVEETTSGKLVVKNQMLWPAKGKITDIFGFRKDPFNGSKTDYHNGIDIAVDTGTPVKAALNGTVTISRFDRTYGNYIVITHSDGIKTLYAHLDKRFSKEGDTVQKGDVIAASGNTGNSTGPHLHFEILMGGTTRIDPLSLLPDE